MALSSKPLEIGCPVQVKMKYGKIWIGTLKQVTRSTVRVNLHSDPIEAIAIGRDGIESVKRITLKTLKKHLAERTVL